MKVGTEHTPQEIRRRAAAWFDRQVAILQQCHGNDWPKHREWLEAYLREQLRQRLLQLGWRPKR